MISQAIIKQYCILLTAYCILEAGFYASKHTRWSVIISIIIAFRWLHLYLCICTVQSSNQVMCGNVLAMQLSCI